MILTALLLFWCSLFLLFYIYAGYPLWIGWRARRAPVREERGAPPATCSIVIAAYNEAARLPAKIGNLLAQTAAPRIVEILIGSDGSTDGTAEVLRGVGDPRVRVVAFPERRGKPSVLNDLLAMATGEVVVLMDARQKLEPNAIEALMDRMACPDIGVVSGELVFVREGDTTATAQGMGAYWAYEKWIRKQESAGGSVPGATGALYAVRRSLVQPLRRETLLDDVALPMMAMAGGARCVFEGRAVAYDTPSQDAAKEAIRKRRTIAGVVQLARWYPSWWRPGGHPCWFEFASHKIARLFSPLALVLLGVSSVMLCGSIGYALVLVAQALFYLVALLGWWCDRHGVRVRWLGVPFMFLAMNGYTVLAWWDVLRGRSAVTWRR